MNPLVVKLFGICSLIFTSEAFASNARVWVPLQTPDNPIAIDYTSVDLKSEKMSLDLRQKFSKPMSDGAIDLPEFSSQPIIWHENLIPLIVNIDVGRLYVVGTPANGRAIEQYGNQAPPDIGYVWENGKWVRIPFSKIPEKIYTINMLKEGLPPRGTSFLSLKEKNGPELNGDPRGLSRLDPNQGCFCNQ